MEEQGVRILGTPLGHPFFVKRKLEKMAREHGALLKRLETLQDTHCAWRLLLYCTNLCANYFASSKLIEDFARTNDETLWNTFCKIANLSQDVDVAWRRGVAQFPFWAGGLGLWSAARWRSGAF